MWEEGGGVRCAKFELRFFVREKPSRSTWIGTNADGMLDRSISYVWFRKPIGNYLRCLALWDIAYFTLLVARVRGGEVSIPPLPCLRFIRSGAWCGLVNIFVFGPREHSLFVEPKRLLILL